MKRISVDCFSDVVKVLLNGSVQLVEQFFPPLYGQTFLRKEALDVALESSIDFSNQRLTKSSVKELHVPLIDCMRDDIVIGLG